MKILGISAFYHDSSASLLVDGDIVAANQEERFTRVKHDSAFPKNAILACLKQANCTAADIDHIVFYEKPFLKFERLLETYLAFAPKGFVSFQKAIPVWLSEKLFQKKMLTDELTPLGFNEKQTDSILFSEHHLSHAASAFYPSPYKDALVLTMDGVGEWETTTVYLGKDNKLKKVKELRFPHSLGMLYSAFTYYCGFKVNSGEYKLMGLAPYGVPRFADTIKEHLLILKEDGSFQLDMSYFNYATGLTMTNKKFDRLFQSSFRNSESELKQVHMDLAASIQIVLEEIVLKICKNLKSEHQIENLCLAGGVALNCVANGKIEKSGLFKNIWIQPAAGDAGGSLGAALSVYYDFLDHSRKISSTDSMKGAYLGPSFSNNDIEQFLKSKPIVYKQLSEEALLNFVSEKLSENFAIGWFQGSMEFGPRSLGNRSILASPLSNETQKNLNLKVKFRESFRPFAPAVLEEDVQNWFNYKDTSPYMLMVAELLDSHKIEMSEKEKLLFGIEKLNVPRSKIPAVTHVDYSARLQTVSKKTNPRFHKLIEKFKEKTKIPILVNTSFNIRGEPIVCTPEDAFRCFMGTDLDLLVLENFVLLKTEQSKDLLSDYRKNFDLD